MIRIGAEPFSNTTMEEKIQKKLQSIVRTIEIGQEEFLKNGGNYLDMPVGMKQKSIYAFEWEPLIRVISEVFQETIEQAMPEKWKNVMGMSYRIGYNDALDEFRSKVLKDIGCDINVTSK